MTGLKMSYHTREATNLVGFTDQVLTFCCFFSNFALLKVLADLNSSLDVCSEVKFKCRQNSIGI
jgi:hypothetical protein